MGEFAILSEMRESIRVIRNLDTHAVARYAPRQQRVMFSGEGSSRIFPAKNAIAHALRTGSDLCIATEGALQASEYPLEGRHVYVGSNSGRTAEGVKLIRAVAGRRPDRGTTPLTAVVAHGDTPIANEADDAYVLTCGPERAVAATKSVIEQALFYRLLVDPVEEDDQLDRLASAVETALNYTLPPELVKRCATARTICFAGRNDGVAEELTLKTNEITRKQSAFFEGTYAVHGVEEVLTERDVVIVVDPFSDQEAKFEEVLLGGVGAAVFAIAPRATRFPTVPVPEVPGWDTFVQIAAGWNVLTAVGDALGVDIDRPERARKVGNELVD